MLPRICLCAGITYLRSNQPLTCHNTDLCPGPQRVAGPNMRQYATPRVYRRSHPAQASANNTVRLQDTAFWGKPGLTTPNIQRLTSSTDDEADLRLPISPRIPLSCYAIPLCPGEEVQQGMPLDS